MWKQDKPWLPASILQPCLSLPKISSFNTPTLFIIAEDLSKMEIHALVDESDIGQIKEGQHARFTVNHSECGELYRGSRCSK
ncbi:hypothetical protein B1H10_01970 [candidate division KSB1 bacterium 4484_188]|nr:MAG: hypothetical protein B1H10_01970 [candidate division KSB1 bacterium 4484_188]